MRITTNFLLYSFFNDKFFFLFAPKSDLLVHSFILIERFPALAALLLKYLLIISPPHGSNF